MNFVLSKHLQRFPNIIGLTSKIFNGSHIMQGVIGADGQKLERSKVMMKSCRHLNLSTVGKSNKDMRA